MLIVRLFMRMWRFKLMHSCWTVSTWWVNMDHSELGLALLEFMPAILHARHGMAVLS